MSRKSHVATDEEARPWGGSRRRRGYMGTRRGGMGGMVEKAWAGIVVVVSAGGSGWEDGTRRPSGRSRMGCVRGA